MNTPAATGAGVYCGFCGSKNPPGTRFCGSCGRPLGVGAAAPATTPPRYGPATTPRLISGRLWIWFLGGGTALFLIVVMAALGVLLSPTPPALCREPCNPPPPTSPALPPPMQYTSAAYGYSLEYYLAPTVQDSKTIRWVFNGTWSYGFTAEPAQGRSAQQVAEQIKQSQFSDAAFVFQIPAAGLGYNAGYGAVYDLTISGGTGQTAHARLLLIVSVKKGLAIEMIALGPYQQQTGGHPNPAATKLPRMSGVVNSVVFPGDAPE
ncbi:MAG TPA: zinc ribbon domain-containing protein [Candidatus Dormibacteraeota bacterium]|nr:zinc ribbon domain-containing protein [Candidatus Dormibacteraeota bacterium]